MARPLPNLSEKNRFSQSLLKLWPATTFSQKVENLSIFLVARFATYFSAEYALHEHIPPKIVPPKCTIFAKKCDFWLWLYIFKNAKKPTHAKINLRLPP